MKLSDSHSDLPLPEQHGVQLRMAADRLEEAVADVNTREEFLIRRAQALADSLAIRNEVRDQLQSSDLSV